MDLESANYYHLDRDPKTIQTENEFPRVFQNGNQEDNFF